MPGLLQLFVGSKHIGAVWQIKVLGILVSGNWNSERLANN